jgi:hypothetical protein
MGPSLFQNIRGKMVGGRNLVGNVSQMLAHVILLSSILGGSLKSVSTAVISNHRSEREASSRTVKTDGTGSCGSYGTMPESRDDVDTSAIPRPRPLSLSNRNFSESSHLCDLRDEFATCELNKSVVRIEVGGWDGCICGRCSSMH